MPLKKKQTTVQANAADQRNAAPASRAIAPGDQAATRSRRTAPPGQPAPSDRPGLFSLLGTASTMGLHMVTGPVVGAGLGWLADKWLDSWPAGSAIGLLLGVAAGFRNVWADARWLIQAQEPGPGPEPDTAPEPGKDTRPDSTRGADSGAHPGSGPLPSANSSPAGPDPGRSTGS